MPPISNALFADTDGDGELEAVCWKKVGSDADDTKRYVISVVPLDGSGVTRDFFNDLGRPAEPKNEHGYGPSDSATRSARNATDLDPF